MQFKLIFLHPRKHQDKPRSRVKGSPIVAIFSLRNHRIRETSKMKREKHTPVPPPKIA